MKAPKTKMRGNEAVAFLRVSSRKQRDNNSHDTQLFCIQEYCKRKGLVIVEVFRLVESARDSESRKQYNAAKEKALSMGVQHFVFFMQDRESRNASDLEANEKLIREGKISLHIAYDNKVYDKNTPADDFFVRDVNGSMNTHFSRKQSVRVNAGMSSKAERGDYPSNRPPLGYLPIANTQGAGGKTVGIDPRPEKVKQVQREFELRAMGYTLKDIRKAIIEEGFIPPAKVAGYGVAVIDARLKNPFYRGSFKWKDQVYKGRHELIIPQHTLEAQAFS